MKYKAQDYPVQIWYSVEDKAFIAQVLDMPGISAFGETREAAAREIEIPLGMALGIYEEDGTEPPAPGSGRIKVIAGRRAKKHERLVYIDVIPNPGSHVRFIPGSTKTASARKTNRVNLDSVVGKGYRHQSGLRSKNLRASALVK